MPNYTLSITIHAESKELLENLMVTLETISHDIDQLNMIELFSVIGPDSVTFDTRPRTKGPDKNQTREKHSSVMQRSLYLDKWMFL